MYIHSYTSHTHLLVRSFEDMNSEDLHKLFDGEFTDSYNKGKKVGY